MSEINSMESFFSKVAIIGLGYIGLPTAAILASRKIPVLGVDVDPQTVEVINQGKIHIVEPDLDIIVHAAVTEGFLKASLKVEPADAFIIAVPTPFKEAYEPDLSYIKAACEVIAPVLKKGDLVVLESTSPVGTTEQIETWLSEMRRDLTFPQLQGDFSDIRIAYCPERVLPGHILREMLENDRIIGGLTPKCSALAAQLYGTFVEGEILITNSRTAEMCKLTENSFRDVNIAFANELSIICDKLDINVWELISLANCHPRVNILNPGPGVGGHCIAVDPWFIVSKTPKEALLIRTAREVNDNKPNWVINKVHEAVSEFVNKNPQNNVKDVTIACFGLTFKADIDDLRESPALDISLEIAKTHPGKVFIIEPHIEVLPKQLASVAQLCTGEHAIAEANILLILVDHKVFQHFYKNFTKEHVVIMVPRDYIREQ